MITKGIGLIEIIVSIGIWMVLMSAGVALLAGSFRSNRLADETNEASNYAQEGIDAVLSIKEQGWKNPLLTTDCTGGCGVATVSGTWGFSGSNNVNGKYTRQIFVTPVNRNCDGDIVTSGGDADPNTYKVESRVTWNRGAPNITDTKTLTEYITNYKGRRGGMLVYGNGGTTTDAIEYRIFDGDAWGTASSSADIDAGSSNRALRLVRLYQSACKEKIMISRHATVANQYIYAQVYNGVSWGNVQLLASWAGPTFLGVENFSGTYLDDGTFMVVYADNTVIPKYRTWNGTTWSAEGSLNTLGAGQIPNFMVVSARPGTNEVMAAVLTRTDDTKTQYWNGSTWSAVTTHATQSPDNQKKMVDFAWSPNNPLIGGLIYSDANNDKTLDIKIWTADGAGSGSWSGAASSTAQANNLGGMAIGGRNGADEFIACDKDSLGTPRIICYKSDFTPSWTNPTNQILTTSGYSGDQRSYHIGFEQLYGNAAIAVYSDDTTTPKLKKYTAGTSTWDLSPTSISSLAGVPSTVRLVPVPVSDDILILLGDENNDLYSIFWSGDTDVVFSSPAELALTLHATNGSADSEDWYDFNWDKP